jgi:site-specific recombinase XerD
MVKLMSQKYDVVRAWLDNVAYAHSRNALTEGTYRNNFNHFLKFVDRTPEQILAEYEASNDKDFRRKYAQIIRAWISGMVHEELASYTVQSRVGAVKSFFMYNDLPLGHVPVGKAHTEFHNRDITKEEVLILLQGSRPREKAFYAIMCQSGLRPETICNLKLKHLLPDYTKGTVPCRINVPREITKGEYRDYFTFIGDDALHYLKAWLSTRANLTAESYIFTKYNSEEPLDRSSASHRFGQLAIKLRAAGTLEYGQKKAGKPAELRLYSLRKYFRKYANQAGFEFVQFWMGHVVSAGKEENYRPTDVEFHRQLYRKRAMPFLRLESATPSETEKTIEAQAEKIKNLEQEKAELMKGQKSLEEQVADIRRILDALQKQVKT